MNLVEAVFLGLIQGITEFLPVSSSGHLVLFQKLLGQIKHDLLFDVSAHLGTVFAVIIVYKESLLNLLNPLFLKVKDRTTSLRMLYFVILASIPTGIVGFFFRSFFNSLFSNLTAVGIAFLFTAIVLLFTLRLGGNRKALDMSKGMEGLHTMSAPKAFLIGCAQTLAICPGVSRAGLTVATALFLNVRKDTGTFFSFLIAIPAISGAILVQFFDYYSQNGSQSIEWSIYIVGFISAFVFGYVGLRALMHIVKKGNLAIFSVYLLVLSFICLWGI